VSVAERRSILVGGCGAARRGRPNFFSKISENFLFYPQNFLMTFLVMEKCNKITKHTNVASAARRQIIGGGSSITKSRRRRPQIDGGGGGGGAARRGRRRALILTFLTSIA